ncbi:MAG: periplasmic heavy metal sensor [Fuerstiella sp.]|nr:periplasmic heavy metal sensor [Fuerstiella sp.]MCP4856285.1 periplasmic heavy metal sensor [Fuerstiella sp.]
MKSQWLCVFLFTVYGAVAEAQQQQQRQQQSGDPLQNLLIPPEVLIHHRAEIGLSEEQVRQIHNLVEKVGPEIQGLQERANDAMGRLAELLSKDSTDVDSALKQLDQFLVIEKEQKLHHLRVMIQIRNELTTTQRQAAFRIVGALRPDEGLEQRLKAKLARIETKMQSRAKAGPPPFDAVGLMQKFPVLMQNGQTREAELLLDRVIGTLGLDKTNRPHVGQALLPPARPIDSTLTADGLNDARAQAEFYRMDEVQTIQLRVAPEDMQRLVAALPERIYVPAFFQWRDVTVDKVAVRFKGNSSASPHQRHKRSFLIKFNEYKKSARFFGLRRASFDNGVQFGSLFSEPLITEILRDQGLPTHRTNYARIFLNNEYLGVYVNVERIDETFVEQHLPDPRGALFKIDEGGPGCNLQFIGDDPSIYKKAFEAKSDSAKRTRARLVDFIRMINQTEPGEFASTLESSMELDDFLRVSAIMLFSGAFDQLTGWGPHNYYLYHDPGHDRWRYLPWDLDVGFCEKAFGRIDVLGDWHAAWPVAPSGRHNPLMERIVANPELLNRYRQVARTILDKYFQPERLCGIIDANYELIKEDLRSDPFPHQRVTVPGDRGYDGIVESIKTFMRKRYVSAVEQLDNPGPRPEIVHAPNGDRGLPPRLAEKVRRIEQRAGQMQKNGQDILPIQKMMQRIRPLLQQGKIDEAEELMDEALKLAGETPG